jgi:AraC-like DNA-binding protein
MRIDPVIYRDKPGDRLLDLRPDGVGCIPALGMSSYLNVREGTEEHCHPGCVEIVLNLRGRLMFESLGEEYPFMPGSVFVSAPDQPHRMRLNPKGLILQRILFEIPKKGRGVLGFSVRETEWLVRSLTHLPKRVFAATDKIKNAFAALFEIHDEDRRKGYARRLKMKTATADLLVSVIEAARKEPTRAPSAIADIARRIAENPERDYQIEELSKEAGLAPAKFFENFKRETGLPPHSFILNCRIRRAQTLLENGKRSIDAISGMLRFSSRQHFSTVFKHTLGTTPARYRLKCKSAKSS